MPAINRVASFVRTVGLIAACVLIPAQIAVAVFFVVGRQFVWLPGTLLQELEWYLFMSLVYLTFGYAYLADRHVRIDILRERMTDRTQAWIEIIGFFIALMPCFVVVLWMGADSAWQSLLANEGSRSPTGMPWRWIVRLMIPIGAFLLLMAGAVVTVRSICALRRGHANASSDHSTGQVEQRND